jgi:hypothetical protein
VVGLGLSGHFLVVVGIGALGSGLAVVGLAVSALRFREGRLDAMPLCGAGLVVALSWIALSLRVSVVAARWLVVVA